MALDIYGGDPRIIATQHELLRIASLLEQAASHLEEAWLAPPETFLEVIPNPLPNLQLAFSLPPVIDGLRSLRVKLNYAAESYFSTEAQVQRLLSSLFEPYTKLNWFLSQPNPVSGVLNDQVMRTAATMAVVGLTGVPSFAKAQLVAQATNLTVAALGGSSPRDLLSRSQATSMTMGIKVDAGGSARLVSSTPVKPAANIYGQVLRLQQNYWNPASSIRVEVFPANKGRDFVVYIPGTQSFLPGSKNPLNIQSNLTAMGNVVPSPSQMAVSQALAQLGATKTDRVLFVGHSQGALIGGNLAATEQPYQVKGLISLGGPISHLNLDVPVLALQHAADPVPSLSGGVNPMAENWVTVSSDRGFDSLVDAHRISSYAETTAELVGSENQGYRRIARQLLPEGDSGTEYLFEITRD